MSMLSEHEVIRSSPETPPPPEPAPRTSGWDAAFDVFTRADWVAIRDRVMPRLGDVDGAAIERCVVAAERDVLRALCVRTLVLELNCARLLGQLTGETPEQRFADFSSRFSEAASWSALFEEYAVLGGVVGTLRQQFRDQVVELCDRLAADTAALVARGLIPRGPSRLIALDASMSDPHRGGRVVWKLTFTSDDARHVVMYKPKPLAIDARFQAVLARCNAAIERGELAGVPPFRTLDVVDRGDYGWMEFLTAPGCDDEAAVARFYCRQGALLALLHVLLGTDMHHENLIAHGEHPIIVDLETLFHPFITTREASASAKTNAEEGFEHSVLRIGLLPWRALRNEGNPGINVGALGDGESQALPFPVQRWEGAGRDDMRLVDKPGVMSAVDNLPRIGDRRVAYFEYAGVIADGFEGMLRYIARTRDEWTAPGGVLDGFADDPVRYVVRPTSTYEKVLHATGHPDHLRTPDTAVHVRDALDATGDAIARMRAIRVAEDADLAARDVPYFSGLPGSTGIWDSRGERLDVELPASMLEMARAQLTALDADDVERQLWCTRAALAADAFKVSSAGFSSGTLSAREDDARALDTSYVALRKVAREHTDGSALGEDASAGGAALGEHASAECTEGATLDDRTNPIRAPAVVERASPTGALAAGDAASTLRARAAGGEASAVSARAVALAAELGDRLAKRAIAGSDGVTWAGLVDAGADTFTLGVLGADLYDGVAGIALFFAMLGRATGEPRFVALAEQAARCVRGELAGPASSATRAASGGFVGAPSQLYALAHVGEAALVPALEPALERFAATTSDARGADIIYGAAGAILGLIAAYQVTYREAIVPHMLAALEIIERTAVAQQMGIAWPTAGFARPLLGFSHGTAGIAYALARLGTLLHREGHPAAARCDELAAGARDHERAGFDARRRNWPDFRGGQPEGKNVIAWCHGAPGVVVSRLAGPLTVEAQAELETGIATTLDADTPAAHTLCHGEVGNLAIVAHAADRLGRDHWRQRVAARLPALLDGVASRLTLDIAFADAAPGLMTGIAGIGCGLLALAAPGEPFVLALEPPR
jgi:lantibiotic modifying enzyme